MEEKAMALVPYRDWLPFNQLKDEINRLFNTVGDSETSGAMAGWVPSVDIYESDDRFDLLVDLPGVDPQKVELTLDNGVLTISGDRPVERAVGEGRREVRVRLERGAGKFYRRFILPETVDAEQIQASGRNGVLEIQIRKQARAQPRRINVAA
jgi:HSP20 family protein